ncbi:dual specificity protein phosphatase family protein [Xenophilus sp.]|uniref:phosphatase domain-containing protein n=1 Tax=Xenophilus sp. TaxID=1873499 RepID=UPI0037DC0C85
MSPVFSDSGAKRTAVGEQGGGASRMWPDASSPSLSADSSIAKPFGPAAQVLEVEGFGVAFGERVILAEVNLWLPMRGVTALIGPTGTGKSTLLRSLAGLNDGNPRFRRWGHAAYRGEVVGDGNRPALVQQHARLMQARALDALADGARSRGPQPPSDLEGWALALLDAMEFPELRPYLRAQCIDLPPMLQRALAILRDAACDDALLMVDEPTFGLADYDAFVLLDLLRRIATQRCVLVVLHNLRHVQRVAEEMLLLAGGRIQEAATVERFFTEPVSMAGRQMLATGSCALPAPDADAESLAEDVEPPPPLPTIAQLALKAAPESLGPRGFTWVVPGRLAGTPKPGVVNDIDYDLQALSRVGITCLITLTEDDLPQDALRRNGLTNLHLPIRDREPPTVAQIAMLLVHMERLMARGEVLAAHCLAGIGRTGTVLACWLIREGLTAEEALKRVRRIEPRFVQSEEQEAFLHRYEHEILRRIA